MSLLSFNELRENEKFTPSSELARLQYLKDRRDLYNGNFIQLGIGPNDIDQRLPGIVVNWFRKVAHFYPDFMLAERPDILIADNIRFQNFISDMAAMIWDQVHAANVDMLCYGYGVLASHPYNPMMITRFQPDLHYEVISRDGEFLGDQLYQIRGDALYHGRAITPYMSSGPTNDKAQIDIFDYPVDGPAIVRTYKFNSGTIGEFISSETLPERSGRQVIKFSKSMEETSIFDDMKSHIGEICRVMTSLAKTIRRNLRPSLYGPDGALAVDESGNAIFNIEGNYIPLQPDDQTPAYLQWDSKVEAVSFAIDYHTDTALSMAGLNRNLFRGDLPGNVGLSGQSLRRLLIPFIANTNSIKETNTQVVHTLLDLVNRNNAAGGGELYSYETRNIEIEWHFESIFTDDEGGNPEQDRDNRQRSMEDDPEQEGRTAQGA